MRRLRIILTACFLILFFGLPRVSTLAVLDNLQFGELCRSDGKTPPYFGDKPITINGELQDCKSPYVCLPVKDTNPRQWRCQKGDPASKAFGQVVPPQQILNLGFGAIGISSVLSNIINLLFAAAAITTLFMIIFSAFQWITSGGEKENVAKARGRLTWAIIGLVLLSLAFLLMRVLGSITGFSFFAEPGIPPVDCSANPWACGF